MRGVLQAAVVLLSFGILFAGNIDILGIRSAEYLMELSRNAATGCADGATYNPAGLVHLEEGLHVNFGAQYIGKDYTISGTFLGTTEETETGTTRPTPFIPNLYAVYRTGEVAVFGGFNVPAGGGTLEYEDGLFFMPQLESVLVQAQYGPQYFAMLQQGSNEGSSVYMRGIAGVSYAISESFSAGVGGRYTMATRTMKGSADFAVIDATTGEAVATVSEELDVERTASGFSGVISVNYRPNDLVNLAARYETSTALDFETSASVQSGWEALLPYLADGATQRRDLPAVAAIGVEIVLNEKLRLGGSGNYYFVEAADQGADDGIMDAYGDGWEANVSARYQISPEVAAGLGYSYSNYGGNDTTYTDLEYNLNAGLLSGGLNWQASSVMDFTLAAGTTFFEEGQGTGIYSGETYEKEVFFLAVGANASF